MTTCDNNELPDQETQAEYFRTHFVGIETVAYMFGVTTRTIMRWQRQRVDPLPVDIKGGKGKPNLYHLNIVHQWGVRQEDRKAGRRVPWIGPES